MTSAGDDRRSGFPGPRAKRCQCPSRHRRPADTRARRRHPGLRRRTRARALPPAGATGGTAGRCVSAVVAALEVALVPFLGPIEERARRTSVRIGRSAAAWRAWRVHGGFKAAGERHKGRLCRDSSASSSSLVTKGSARTARRRRRGSRWRTSGADRRSVVPALSPPP